MNRKLLAPALILSLGLAAGLAGCAPAEEDQKATPAPSVSATPNATPTLSPDSEDVEIEQLGSSPKTSKTPPAAAAELFKGLPKANWIYSDDEGQSMALTDSYELEGLKAFEKNLLAAGWAHTVEPDLVGESYVASLSNPKTNEGITLIAMKEGAPDENGKLTLPVSSVIYQK